MTNNDSPGSDHLDYWFLQALRRIAGQIDPEPATVTAGAMAAFSWRTIDAELATLTHDSLLDDDALAGVRSGGPRQ